MIAHRLPFVLALALGAPTFAQAKVDFARQVWPILEKRCVECHATPKAGPDGKLSKPKGGVVLDSKEGISTGKRGRLAVAGKPDESQLLMAVTLPADDEDRMPPAKKGDPLSKEQTDLIRDWISQGAAFGSWTGVKAKEVVADAGKGDKGAAKPGDRPLDPFLALQKGLQPLGKDVLATFAKGPFVVTNLGDDSPLLRVSCSGQTELVDDAAVAELLPIATHVAELDLSRSRVGDVACATIAKMPRLVVVDLRQTLVENHGVAALAACKELRVVNLFGTKVGDYGATALATMKQLREVYLWQTEVSAAAVVRLKESVPGVKVVVAADLPEPMAETPAGGARRKAGNK
jgi:Planctomycete cytochrome C